MERIKGNYRVSGNNGTTVYNAKTDETYGVYATRLEAIIMRDELNANDYLASRNVQASPIKIILA